MYFASVKKAACLAMVLIAGGVFGVQAQTTGSNPASSKSVFNIQKPTISPQSMSLLDPNRFSMKQSYIASFSSSGGSSGAMGTYINSMEYRFNAPLILRLKVAYQTQTGALFNSRNTYSGLRQNDQGRMFVPSFDLIYKPFKNTTVNIAYRDYTGMSRGSYYDRYNSFGSGFDYQTDMMMYRALYGYDQFKR
jgi:hypothetical protein